LFPVVTASGVASGRMPLAGRSNQVIELDRWPIVFWLYTGAVAAFGVGLCIWSALALAGKNRNG